MKSHITYRWRRSKENLKEPILAIYYAVKHGYNTRDDLIAALPQFSRSRLLLALDALLSANLAEINLDILSVSEDVAIIQKIVNDPIDLDIAAEEVTPAIIRQISMAIGLSNPAGVEALLRATAVKSATVL